MYIIHKIATEETWRMAIKFNDNKMLIQYKNVTHKIEHHRQKQEEFKPIKIKTQLTLISFMKKISKKYC